MSKKLGVFSKGILGLCLLLQACQSAGFKRAPHLSHLSYKNKNSYFYFLSAEMSQYFGKHETAKQELQKAIEKDKSSSFLYSKLADMDAKLGNIEEAFTNVQQALKKDPKNIEALLLYGKLLAVKRKPDLAIKSYKEVLAIDSKNEEAYNVMAREYLTMGNQLAAEKTLKKCAYAIQDSISCLFYLGSIYYEGKHFNRALKYFKQITDLNPGQVRIWRLMAEIYVNNKNYKKALDVYKQIAQNTPSDLMAQIKVALIYYELNNVTKAIEEMNKIAIKFPESDRVNYFLGLMYHEQNNHEKAIEYYKRIHQDSELYAEAFKRMMQIYYQGNKLDEALLLVDQKYRKKASKELLLLKSSLYVTKLEYQKSIDTLSEGIRKFSDNKGLLFQRAVVYETMGDWPSAKKDLLTLLKQEPNLAEAMNFLGYTMVEQGEDIDEALKYLEKANELKPNQGHILDSLGWAYFKKGETQKALQLVSQAHHLVPEEPTILEHLADIYFSLKDKKRARHYYEKSLIVLKKIERKKPEDQEQIENIYKKLGQF